MTQQRYATAALIAATVASVVSSGAVIGYNLSAPAGTILPGVYVAGVDVGGLTPAQAQAYLARHIEAQIGRPITVRLAGESWSVIPRDLGVHVSLEAMLAKAYTVGYVGSAFKRIRERFYAARQGVFIPLDVRVDEVGLNAWLDTMAARIDRAPQDAEIKVATDGSISIVPSKTGYRLDRSGVAERMAQTALKPAPRDFRLTVTRIAPGLSTAAARSLGVKRLMGAFTTEFDSADEDRTENIRIAAKALDGLLIEPGETFSFNSYVGPRIASSGYKEAPVIIDGELVPDIGGGVCQVSTTLYNAVLLAGIKVSQRIPHSIPASYVPLGRDATVAYDYIDFKFTNDTSRHVMIMAEVHDEQVTVAFYGDGPSYRRVRLESEVLNVMQPKVVETPRAEMAAGERRVIKQGREGYQVHVWRVAETDGGRVERKLVSRSVYKPWERVIWVGSGPHNEGDRTASSLVAPDRS